MWLNQKCDCSQGNWKKKVKPCLPSIFYDNKADQDPDGDDQFRKKHSASLDISFRASAIDSYQRSAYYDWEQYGYLNPYFPAFYSYRVFIHRECIGHV